jgi:ribosomal protein L11 methyltransferase
VRAGRFFIYGMHDRGRTPRNTVNLRIEAGAAFGTGHHGTTVGCLLAYDRLIRGRRFRKVLDVGAGTGVLAIAALKTGATTAVGTDIDRPSVRICRENAQVNKVKATFAWTGGLTHPAVRGEAPYDLIFANILARPLVGLSQAITEALKPGGVIVLSGLLRHQERYVRAAYLARGFKLDFRIRRDAWSALVLTKRGRA